MQVNSKLKTGDIEGAKEASDKALYYSNASVITGLVMFGLVALVFISIFLLLIFVAIDAAHGFHPRVLASNFCIQTLQQTDRPKELCRVTLCYYSCPQTSETEAINKNNEFLTRCLYSQ